MRFVDTNVLIYSISSAPDEREKCLAAEAILDEASLFLSVQVLQEFYVQATRVSRENRISHENATHLIRLWRRHSIQEMTVELLDKTLEAKERWQISYWDAAIIEAARMQGCTQVLSEDLSHGQDYDGVRVVDPFR
jgi:predicted nucleic acid-binding protein